MKSFRQSGLWGKSALVSADQNNNLRSISNNLYDGQDDHSSPGGVDNHLLDTVFRAELRGRIVPYDVAIRTLLAQSHAIL